MVKITFSDWKILKKKFLPSVYSFSEKHWWIWSSKIRKEKKKANKNDARRKEGKKEEKWAMLVIFCCAILPKKLLCGQEFKKDPARMALFSSMISEILAGMTQAMGSNPDGQRLNLHLSSTWGSLPTQSYLYYFAANK